MLPSGDTVGYVVIVATRSVISAARPLDQARPVLTHLARKVRGDTLVIMQIRRILGVDEGEPALPGQRNVIRPGGHAPRPLENGEEFVQMNFRNRMTPCRLIVVARNEVPELGHENRRLAFGTTRGMTWRTEEPFARHAEVSKRLLVNKLVNPFGLITSGGKVLPAARFLPLATLLFDEKHLENVPAKCRMGRDPHEASRILASDLKARFKKVSLVIDRVGSAKQLLKKYPGQMIGRQKVTTHRFSNP
jgi:hypothetical protein